jgi:hypothetical protein
MSAWTEGHVEPEPEWVKKERELWERYDAAVLRAMANWHESRDWRDALNVYGLSHLRDVAHLDDYLVVGVQRAPWWRRLYHWLLMRMPILQG